MSVDVPSILAVRKSDQDMWQLFTGMAAVLQDVKDWQHVDFVGLITLQGAHVGTLDEDFLTYLLDQREAEWRRARELERLLREVNRLTEVADQ